MHLICAVCLQDNSQAGRLQQERLHALLWNQGTRHFQAREHRRAVAMFEADLQYAPGEEKSRVARTLGMCSLAIGLFDRCEDVKLAEGDALLQPCTTVKHGMWAATAPCCISMLMSSHHNLNNAKQRHPTSW